MLKDKTFWISVVLTIVLTVVLIPYQMFGDMYIAEFFAALCTMLTVMSAPIFGVLFYLWRKNKLFGEYFSAMIALLVFSVVFHGIFAMMSWESCVFAVTSVLLILALTVGKIVRKK